MAKTNFVEGTTVTPAFLNAINAQVHDGADSDGHAAKIDLALAAQVTGQLPVANQAEHVHSGGAGQFAKIDLGSAAHVTGQLPIANLVATTLDQITASGTFDATFPTAKTLTFHYQKFASGIVKIWWLGLTGMDSGITHTASGTPVPEAIRPSEQLGLHCFVQGAGVIAGEILLLTTGGLSILALDGATNNTAIIAGCAEYPL